MKDPAKFVAHVKDHTTTAMWHLKAALDLLEKPEPGLTTWMMMTGERLEQAKAEIEKAQRMP